MKVEMPTYKYWFIVITLIIIFTLFMFNTIHYEKFYTNSGVVIDNDTMKVYCGKEDLQKIINNKKIIIGGENFAYKNVIINNIIFDKNYFFELTFDVDLNSKLNVKNNLLDFKISLGKKTIFKYILSKIGGEK